MTISCWNSSLGPLSSPKHYVVGRLEMARGSEAVRWHAGQQAVHGMQAKTALSLGSHAGRESYLQQPTEPPSNVVWSLAANRKTAPRYPVSKKSCGFIFLQVIGIAINVPGSIRSDDSKRTTKTNKQQKPNQSNKKPFNIKSRAGTSCIWVTFLFQRQFLPVQPCCLHAHWLFVHHMLLLEHFSLSKVQGVQLSLFLSHWATCLRIFC